jgi:hypothetical protein
MKKVYLFAGIAMCTVSMTFAGGFGGVTPPTMPERVVKPVEEPLSSLRWYEGDTKSSLSVPETSRFRTVSRRYSDSQTPVVYNRATSGKDLEREFDRQAAARKKLLRLRSIGR